jgi:hypothetical protein
MNIVLHIMFCFLLVFENTLCWSIHGNTTAKYGISISARKMMCNRSHHQFCRLRQICHRCSWKSFVLRSSAENSRSGVLVMQPVGLRSVPSSHN